MINEKQNIMNFFATIKGDIPIWNNKGVFICSNGITSNYVVSKTMQLDEYTINNPYKVLIFSQGITNITTINSKGSLFISNGRYC